MLATAGLASASDLQGSAKISLDNSNFIWGQPLTAKLSGVLSLFGKDLTLDKTLSLPTKGATDLLSNYTNSLVNKFPLASWLTGLGKQTTPTTTTSTTPTTTVTNPSSFSLTADEQQVLDLVNKERAANGLNPLKVNPTLTQVARAHSADMINRNFFDHNNPDGKTPFDRIKAAGVTYKTAGENLAGASSVQTAHTNLMNSPGHRANILNASFTEVGIGIVDGGKYGKMFTQNFIGN